MGLLTDFFCATPDECLAVYEAAHDTTDGPETKMGPPGRTRVVRGLGPRALSTREHHRYMECRGLDEIVLTCLAEAVSVMGPEHLHSLHDGEVGIGRLDPDLVTVLADADEAELRAIGEGWMTRWREDANTIQNEFARVSLLSVVRLEHWWGPLNELARLCGHAEQRSLEVFQVVFV